MTHLATPRESFMQKVSNFLSSHDIRVPRRRWSETTLIQYLARKLSTPDGIKLKYLQPDQHGVLRYAYKLVQVPAGDFEDMALALIEASGAQAGRRAEDINHAIVDAIMTADRLCNSFNYPSLGISLFRRFILPMMRCGCRVLPQFIYQAKVVHRYSRVLSAILVEAAELNVAGCSLQSLARRAVLSRLPLGMCERDDAIYELPIPDCLHEYLRFADFHFYLRPLIASAGKLP